MLLVTKRSVSAILLQSFLGFRTITRIQIFTYPSAFKGSTTTAVRCTLWWTRWTQPEWPTYPMLHYFTVRSPLCPRDTFAHACKSQSEHSINKLYPNNHTPQTATLGCISLLTIKELTSFRYKSSNPIHFNSHTVQISWYKSFIQLHYTQQIQHVEYKIDSTVFFLL